MKAASFFTLCLSAPDLASVFSRLGEGVKWGRHCVRKWGGGSPGKYTGKEKVKFQMIRGLKDE